MTRIITAPASKVSSADFLDAIAPLFGKPTKADQAREAELAAALTDHQQAMQRTWKITRLAEWCDARQALKVEYAARVAEIRQRHAEQLTEVHSDPLRRVA